MARNEAEFILERDYNGFTLKTDGAEFFATDENGKLVASAKSLQAVKNQLLKPIPLDIDAVRLQASYGYEEDEYVPERVHIYAVSGAGATLYEKDGKKDKDTYERLRKFDQ